VDWLAETGTIRFIGFVDEVEGELSTIRLKPGYAPGLLDIDEYSHLIILYWFHGRDNEAHRSTLHVTPRRHGVGVLKGVFACRSPSRPNPIGLTVVELLGVEGNVLRVRGLDALQGSPIIDIKPYSPHSDLHPEARAPDWAG
jgi:tRNA-Thr(GGU) m(6)t(6)A37 methyltransferase TsaA